MDIGGPDVDAPARVQRALLLELLEDRQIGQSRAQPGPTGKIIQPAQQILRLEEGGWGEGGLSSDRLLDHGDKFLCCRPPLTAVSILADVVPGLENATHGQKESFSPLHLFSDLGKHGSGVPAHSGDFEEFAEDAGIDEADAHED